MVNAIPFASPPAGHVRDSPAVTYHSNTATTSAGTGTEAVNTCLPGTWRIGAATNSPAAPGALVTNRWCSTAAPRGSGTLENEIATRNDPRTQCKTRQLPKCCPQRMHNDLQRPTKMLEKSPKTSQHGPSTCGRPSQASSHLPPLLNAGRPPPTQQPKHTRQRI